MHSIMAMITGMVSGLHPAMTALAAIFRTVPIPKPGASSPTTWSPLRREGHPIEPGQIVQRLPVDGQAFDDGGHRIVDHLVDLIGGLVGEAFGHNDRARLGDTEGLRAEVGVLVEDGGRVADRRDASAFELTKIAHQP